MKPIHLEKDVVVSLEYLETFQVRRFTPRDLSPVMEINRRCLPENYTPNFFLDVYQNCPESFIVAETNEGIIGYSMCRIEFGFSEFNRFKMRKKGHLVSIAVINEYRRRKIGQQLLTHALKGLIFRRIPECYLEVRKSNLSGIELYKKIGFIISRQISAYYHDGADAYVMATQL